MKEQKEKNKKSVLANSTGKITPEFVGKIMRQSCDDHPANEPITSKTIFQLADEISFDDAPDLL